VALLIQDVWKSYGSVTALAGVSFAAAPGVTAILGANGAGKSTLLRILATVLAPDAGQVSLDGLPYRGDLRPLRWQLGYLPQDLHLPDHLTPRRFLRYMARLKGLDGPDQAAQLLSVLELEAEADRPVSALSGGQVRRLALAQALLGSPRLLVLDEPFRGLDPNERERALALVTGDPGRLVVLSAHGTAEVERIARQVVILRQGRVAFAGPVPALLALTRGQVHEVVVPAAQLPLYLERHLVSRAVALGGQVRLRVVGEPPEGLDARPVAGSLEDAYLLVSAIGCARSRADRTGTGSPGGEMIDPGSGINMRE
jgi:ABC-2 type transport system ATP-binding protein